MGDAEGLALECRSPRHRCDRDGNFFRDGLDARPGDGPIIPRVEDEPWKFTTRQLRRTIAWYIANRPFGTIAGGISVQARLDRDVRGLCGLGPGRLRLAVERERALGQLDIVAHSEAFLRHEGPAGPGATRLRREFARVQDQLGDLPGRVMDRKRLRSVAHLGRTFTSGFSMTASSTLRPHCASQPRRIPNAWHRPYLDAARSLPERLFDCPPSRAMAGFDRRGRSAARRPALSPLQRAAIAQDNDRKRRLIAPLTDDNE